VSKNIFGAPLFDNAAGVHYSDAVHKPGKYGGVMADQHESSLISLTNLPH
jgi:hypothetical protein